MKTNIKAIILILSAAVMFASCESYLEKTPLSDIDDEQVFGSYRNFQGYLDELYGTGLISYYSQTWTASFDMGDDVYCNKTFPVTFNIPMGDYMWIYRNTSHNPFVTVPNDHVGLWDQAWANIRRCNHGLSNLDMLVDATDEERQLLEGQCLFFRAWNHFEVARFWGGLPYVTKYLQPDDDMKFPRLSFRETLLKIADDFAAAAELLPVDWNQTVQGAAAADSNTGRATKGAALALESRALLYAASPLTTKLETGAAEYDEALCKRCVEVANEVIKLADQGVYSLVDWANYTSNFASAKAGSGALYTSETIFAKIRTNKGSGQVLNGIGRIHNSQRFGGNGVVTAPTVNMINLYETATGYAIEDAPAGDYNALMPWLGRDPRFLKTFLVDGVKWVAKNNDESAYVQLYSGGGSAGNGMGLDRSGVGGGSVTGYLIRKYIPYKVNNIDAGAEWNNFKYNCPLMRLAEVYLIYAEAANEAYGPKVVPAGCSLSAVDAVNTVRRRVKMPTAEDPTQVWENTNYSDISFPDVKEQYTATKELFRERIRNERSVELAYEGHRFHDLRRWYLAHLPKYRVRYAAEFDKAHTYYREVELFTGQFDEKHYWFPFRQSDVHQYEAFTQNPGWE